MVQRNRKNPPSKKRLILTGGAGLVLFIAFAGFPKIAALYTDYLWFDTVNQQHVFSTTLLAQLGLGVFTAVVVALILYMNVAFAAKVAKGHTSFKLRDAQGTPQVDLGDVLPKLLRVGSIIVGLLTGLAASAFWDEVLLWQNATSFGVVDPIFGRDVSFYVFTLPLLEASHGVLMWVLSLSAIAAGATHIAKGSIVLEGRPMQIAPAARKHLTLLAIVLFLAFALDAWIEQAKLLYSSLGPVRGASHADVNARLPMLQLLVGASVLGALLLLASIRDKSLRLIFVAVGLYAVVSLLGVRAYPEAVHRFSVLPNEAVKEATYIGYNIEATRAAYGLSEVEERALEGDVEISREDIDNNRATVDNIRVWDHRPLLDTFAQIQEIRTYYEFSSVDNDRYVINGELSQTMLSPRELSAASLPNRTWINEHFTFTHGYGITLGPVNRATEEGLPELYIQDIPPISQLDELPVTRPAIYFGEMTSNYVLVKTENREFDYPAGEDNVYAEYSGTAGVPLDSALNLLSVSTRLNSLALLLSDDITDESRVLLYRNIRERLQRIAPFLVYDRDPYMVVRENGELVWIQDAYTVSDRYPYAERSASGVNYIRNSVKIVIDAYDGDVTFYLNDPEDPIVQSWASIFPDLFTPFEEIPADLQAHLRYPEDLFRLQTEMFTVYHMKRPELVYNREDQWEVPSVTGQNGQRTRMEPYYTIMRLPGEGEDSAAEFIQMIPFTPARKQNLAAWMVARMDGEHRGELVVYSFPKDSLIFGPQQIMDRINQDTEISRQISLWDQQGSEAILGTLLVIPIEEALIYVCPLYLRSEGGRIPELKRVIAVYGTQIKMDRTLDLAIEALFGAAASEIETGVAPTPNLEEPLDPAAQAAGEASAPSDPNIEATTTALSAEARIRASQLFELATTAQRAGDWAAYGEHLRALGEVLSELRDQPAEP